MFRNFGKWSFIALAACLAMSSPVLAQKGKNATTLAASKTLDICEVTPATSSTPATWRYSGVVSVWNEGVLATEGLQITDCIQLWAGKKGFVDYAGTCDAFVNADNVQIPAGTTQPNATVFFYEAEAPAVTVDVRNIARVKILNHSGSVGKPTGPEPKFTWAGGTVPSCVVDCGGPFVRCDVPRCSLFPGLTPNCNRECTYTQGYWGSGINGANADNDKHPWPSPYSRTAIFFNSTMTWQQVLDSDVSGGNAYFNLAHQYIAAVLNAKTEVVPSGVQATITLATAWFENVANTPTSCAAGQCGLQVTWAGTLDTYNNGIYSTASPPHCADPEITGDELV
jgi:hypothetical protein